MIRFLLVSVLLAAGLRAQGFEITDYAPREDRFLVVGRETQLRWRGEDPSIVVRAVYRPGSKVEKVEELGGGGGEVYWTPTAPGLVKLSVYRLTKGKDGKTTETEIDKEFVSVKFGGGFPLGIVVMFLAGLILFGGAGWSIRALLRASEPRA